MNGCRLLKAGLWLFLFAAAGLQFKIPQGAEVAVGTQPAGRERSLIVCSELNADFDGDHIPDLAIGRSDGPGYTVRVQFTTNLPATSLTLSEGGPGIRIFTSDVDRDNRPDIVVTSAASQFPIAIWISESNGVFHAANPWSYFPCQIGTPFSLEPFQPGDNLAGISEDDKPSASRTDAPPHFVVLPASDWVVIDPEQVSRSAFFAEHPARSPPSVA